MSEIRLIDANKLKEKIQEWSEKNVRLPLPAKEVCRLIDNAPTVELKDIYQEGYYDGHLDGYTNAINENKENDDDNS